MDQWIYFLKNEDVKDNFKAKGLDKAKEVLDYLKYSDEEKREYENYKESLHYQASMYESTYVIGKIEGKAEGKMETKMEIAKALKAQNVAIEIILATTGLTLEDFGRLN